MKNLRPDFIITCIWAVGAMTALVLCGTEIIHNQKIVDRLLITIPGGTAIIMGYWFSKGKGNGNGSPHGPPSSSS
jgi:hypothetical protein